VDVKTLSDTLVVVEVETLGNKLADILAEVIMIRQLATHRPKYRPKQWSTHWLRGRQRRMSRHS